MYCVIYFLKITKNTTLTLFICNVRRAFLSQFSASDLPSSPPDLLVDNALSLPPGLPSSVLFLCVCQADSSGDRARARSLCSAAVTAMKAAVKVTSICLRRRMAPASCVTPHVGGDVTDGETLTSLKAFLNLVKGETKQAPQCLKWRQG